MATTNKALLTIMVTKIEALMETNALLPEEEEFIETIMYAKDLDMLESLTKKQKEWIEAIHDRHYAPLCAGTGVK